MAFSVGDRIRFVYTGQEAEVLSVDADGMLQVRTLPDGDILPAFPEDVVAPADFLGILESPNARPRKVKPTSSRPTAAPYFPSDEEWQAMEKRLEDLESGTVRPLSVSSGTLAQPFPLGPLSGLHLLFRGVAPEEEIPVYVLNDSDRSFNCSLRWLSNGIPFETVKLHLPQQACYPLIGIPRPQLSTRLEVEVSIPVLNLARTAKVKPKNVFGLYRGIPGADFSAGLLTLVEKLVGQAAAPDLAEYSRGAAERARTEKQAKPFYRSPIDTDRFARFPREIDLHLHKLVADPSKVDPTEALGFQLRAFADYLREAVELGIPSFFVIHGLGEGRLRQKVREMLREDPHVRDSRNDYHPKYGHGATEVFL